MREGANFQAYLRERGKLVPGSLREGHNVLTDIGRMWLRDLTAWGTLGDLAAQPDVSVTEKRIRWIVMGTGTQPETASVTLVNSPAIVVGSLLMLTVTPIVSWHPRTEVQYYRQFSGTHFAGLTLSEAGLLLDEDSGAGPGLSSTGPLTAPDYSPAAYKTFEPITKIGGQTLTVKWTLRF